MDKNKWRNELKSRRNAIEKDQRLDEEILVLKHLSDWIHNPTLHSWMVYLPFSSELNTTALIQELSRKGRQIFAPRILENNQLGCSSFCEGDELSTQAWGIQEPKSSLMPMEFRPDVVVVPALGFDHQLQRLGYGKGFYDRFLMNRPQLCIGLGFRCQIVETLPIEKHDLALDAVVTADGVIGSS